MISVDYQKRVGEVFGASIKPSEEENWKELYKRLDEEIFNPELTPLDQLLSAAKLGCERAIPIILDADPKLAINACDAKTKLNALMYTASSGHAAATRVLLERGAEFKLLFDSISILYLAYASKSLETVEVCLEFGAKVDFDLAKKILTNKDTDALTLFNKFSQSLDVEDKKKRSVLFELVETADPIDIKALQLAIKHGCDVNHIDARGTTPMHHACGRSHGGAIMCLKDNGAKAFKDNNGNEPFHYLLFEGNPVEQWEISKAEYKRMLTNASFYMLRLSITTLSYYISAKRWLFPPKVEASKKEN